MRTFLLIPTIWFLSCSPRGITIIDVTCCKGDCDTATYRMRNMNTDELSVFFQTLERRSGDTAFTRDTCP